MQKMKCIAVALLAGLLCVACTPKKEKLLRAYEDACQKGDFVEVMRVAGEFEKEYGDISPDSLFTPAELARFETASAILEKKAVEQTMEQLNGTMKQMNKLGVNPWDEDDEDDDE